MARVGESVENGRGERCVWLQTAASSGGKVVAMDVFLQPQAPSPPAHIHLRQQESFQVLSGSIELRMGHDRRVLAAGDQAVIPAGAAHTWAPAGSEPLHCRVELRPALHFEDLQESIFWLVRTGKLDRKNPANLVQAATVFHHYLDEARAASPPAIVQRTTLGALAAIGRLRGYGPYPEHGG
jgi:quercetin dioxygenase-like cupin family protein